MNERWQLRVEDRTGYLATLEGPAEIGRQMTPEEKYPSVSQTASGMSRIVVAAVTENSISRVHLRIEPQADGRFLLISVGSEVGLRDDETRLERLSRGEMRTVSFPVVLQLGNKYVRLQPETAVDENPPIPLTEVGSILAAGAVAQELRPVDTLPQVFISYARKDSLWLEEFQTMLKPFVRRGQFRVWADTRIDPSAAWKAEIEKALESSRAALVLVSKEFLASDFIARVELPAIMERATHGDLTLFWALLSSCPYQDTDFEKYQAIHDPKQPLDRLSAADRNFAVTEICERIKRGLFKLRQSIIPHVAPPAPARESRLPATRPAAIAVQGTPRRDLRNPGDDLEYQMLFAALAAQMELITPGQLTEALVSWSALRHMPIAEHMIERCWLASEDQSAIERLLQKRLAKHDGDMPSTLAAVADATLRDAIRSSGVRDIKDSLDAVDRDTPVDPVAASSGTPRYQWIRVHREGPRGRVWLGRDADLDRNVALKTVGPTDVVDPRARRNFLHEARIAGKLEHPNIVPVYELGQRPDDGQPFYAMRFLRGKSLSNVIADYHYDRREGNADARERRRLLGLFLNVCNAVAYAHSRNILHCDLKPDNVVLGDFGEVYLLDWGLAKEFDRAAATPDQTAPPLQFVPGTRGPGTPAYMSPEQAANRADLIDTRTDVYGLGAVLFEILTGTAPHGREGLDLDLVLRQIVEGETPSVNSLNHEATRSLDQICTQAMAKVITDRYGNVEEFAAAVQLWLDEEPLAVYRTMVESFEKLVLENPGERRYVEGLAKNLVNIGLVMSGMGRARDAEPSYRRAIAEYEKLLAETPGVVRYRADVAACRVHLWSNLRAQGRDEVAEVVHRMALIDYEALIRENPADKEYGAQRASLAAWSLGGIQDGADAKRAEETLPPTVDALSSRQDALAASGQVKQQETGLRYEIVRLLAQGGLGTVFVARDQELDREVALKEIQGELGLQSVARDRILHEAKITARLEHQGIVPIYSFGTYADGRPYYAMRFVNGASLNEAIREFHSAGAARGFQVRDMSKLRELLLRFLQVCHAVHYAHGQGVVHRDIKPGNIMLGNHGETYLMDWGLALMKRVQTPAETAQEADKPKIDQAENSPLKSCEDAESHVTESSILPADVGWETRSEPLVGTPAFMSPEQANGNAQQVGPASDVFGLGATLYCLLTGKSPYNVNVDNVNDVGRMVLRARIGEFPKPSQVTKAIPRPLEAICLKAMSFEPENRYSSAGALADDLECWLSGRPISVHDRPWYRRFFRLW
jgi:serine/threonine protein kinase